MAREFQLASMVGLSGRLRRQWTRIAPRASRASAVVGVCTAALLLAACAGIAPSTSGPVGDGPRGFGRRTGPAPGALAVVSWNVHGGRGDLAALVDDLAAGRLTDGPPRDYLVLLQEAGAHEVRTLAAARALSVFFSDVYPAEADETGIGAVGNAILSTVPLTGARAVDLPRERQRRAAALATIAVGGRSLFVGSTHLENRLGWLRGLFGDRARGRQARALLRLLPPDRPGILGGDMNTMLGPDEPAWRAFLERFPETPDSTQPTFHDRLVLDHLFFDVPDGWTATQQVVSERYGSDHHPVLGALRTEED